jgi:hypothetical protein
VLDLSNTCDAKRASSRGFLLWNGCGASREVRSLIKAQEPLRQEFSGLYTRGLRSRVSVQKRAYDFEPLLTIRACVSAAGEQFQFGGDSVGEEEGSAISDQYPTVRSASAIIADQPIYFPEEKRAVGEVEVVAGGAGGNGKAGGHDGGSNGGGGGHGDSGRDDGESNEEEAFGVLLDSEQVAKELQARGISLPPDMAEAARTVGIRELLLSRYIELQEAMWPLGPAVRRSAMLRNWLLADPSFLFKVFTEIAIDSGCATFAEVQKRGKDFWNEFELYMSDLVVGIVLDIALVGMLAPFVQFGNVVVSGSGPRARLSRIIQALPSSIFEAQRPGRSFSVQQRVASFFFKAGQYGIAGFACGVVGQGIASSIMTLKRKYKKSDEEEVAVPPILQSAVLWGVFMAISSNTRYQVVNGLERVVEGSAISRRVPLVALAFTVGVRFANNIYGGMQFVDWARMVGVQ